LLLIRSDIIKTQPHNDEYACTLSAGCKRVTHSQYAASYIPCIVCETAAVSRHTKCR